MMSGPKDFTKIIDVAASKATTKYQEHRSYSLLLIFTDGKVADMSSTLTKLKSVSSLSLSIIIVGVGPADFSAYLELLDNQERDTYWRNNTSFVSFNAIHGDTNALSQEALRFFPDQLVDFYMRNNIYPSI
mmetsp:Transcript_6924/g.6568  ORF Transcript_6924/g.6568 Transcript_6924/m.6568 type:complete len:131 (-) Transcript_6924:241-633(-)